MHCFWQSMLVEELRLLKRPRATAPPLRRPPAKQSRGDPAMGAASGPPCPRASGTLRPMTSQTFVRAGETQVVGYDFKHIRSLHQIQTILQT